MYLIHYTLSALNVTTAEGSSFLLTGVVNEATDLDNSATTLYSCGHVGATTLAGGSDGYPAAGGLFHINQAASNPGLTRLATTTRLLIEQFQIWVRQCVNAFD